MYKESILTIKSGNNICIPAIYAYDDEIKSEKTLILLHGIATNKNEYHDFYKTLSLDLIKNNYSTVRIDFRGHGDSVLPPSEFTISSQVEDLITTIYWLIKEKGFKKVNLLGTSFGAAPCIFVSNILPHFIDEVFLISPVLDYNKTFITPMSEWGKDLFKNIIDDVLIKKQKLYISDTFYIHSRLVAEMEIINILSFVNKTNRIFHTIHGDADSMVDYSITLEASQEVKNIKLYSFKDMEHGFTYKNDDDGVTDKTKNNITRMLNIIKNYNRK
jgi:predicted alpha/beta-fold hydrolase